MKVEIFRNNTPDMRPSLMYTWTLAEDGTAVCDNGIDQEQMESMGALGNEGTYFPKDGQAFLRALRDQYNRSSLFDAELIE